MRYFEVTNMPTAKLYLNHPYEEQTADQKAAKVEKILRKEEVPIDLMFSINRSARISVSTGERIQPKYWDFKEKRAKKSYTGSIELNLSLDKIKNEVLQAWRENKDKPMHELRPIITEIVRGKSSTSQKKTIFEALNRFLQECEAGKGLNTLKMYRSLQGKLQAFDALYPLDFSTLDFNFYDRFKRFLYDTPNPNYTGFKLVRMDNDCWTVADNESGVYNNQPDVGLFDDTVYKYFTNLKAFISWAEKRGYQTNQSHKTWEIIKKRHEPISLTLDELTRLSQTPLPGHLDVARDYLLLECYTGQRISDIKRFNANDYEELKWTFRQKKGNRLSSKTTTVHFKGFSAPALLILAKYNFKLPEVAEQTINNNIKLACKEAKITEPVHTDRWAGNKRIRFEGPKYEFCSNHTGRKTFITLALSHGMPEAYVMELTGITETQTLKHYRGKFEDKSIEQYLKGVEDSISLLRKSS
jgi:site-specific recombinase XerD